MARGPILIAHDDLELLERTRGALRQAGIEVLSIAEASTRAAEDPAVAEALRRLASDLTHRVFEEEKMDAVSRLAGGMAHDFNNVLAVVLGYGHLALELVDAQHPARSALLAIQRAGERAMTLTSQLAVLSKRPAIDVRPVQLNELLRHVEKSLAQTVGARITTALELDHELGWIQADPTQVEQAIVHLVANARDAMPQGGKVTIRTRAGDGDGGGVGRSGAQSGSGRRRVSLSVQDTGAGMDDATLARLFEPFFTTKQRKHGGGFGLATVYGVVKRAGGDVHVESRPGSGSTFTLTFPCLDAPKETASTPGEEKLHGTETVLLVEDDDIVRSMLRSILTSYGYRLLEAQDGPSALAAAAAHHGPIEVLLTDVAMPDMGGVDLAQRLRATRPAMKVLYVSGYTDDARAHEPSPSETFLAKPFLPATLGARLRTLIDGDGHR